MSCGCVVPAGDDEATSLEEETAPIVCDSARDENVPKPATIINRGIIGRVLMVRSFPLKSQSGDQKLSVAAPKREIIASAINTISRCYVSVANGTPFHRVFRARDVKQATDMSATGQTSFWERPTLEATLEKEAELKKETPCLDTDCLELC